MPTQAGAGRWRWGVRWGRWFDRPASLGGGYPWTLKQDPRPGLEPTRTGCCSNWVGVDDGQPQAQAALARRSGRRQLHKFFGRCGPDPGGKCRNRCPRPESAGGRRAAARPPGCRRVRCGARHFPPDFAESAPAESMGSRRWPGWGARAGEGPVLGRFGFVAGNRVEQRLQAHFGGLISTVPESSRDRSSRPLSRDSIETTARARR